MAPGGSRGSHCLPSRTRRAKRSRPIPTSAVMKRSSGSWASTRSTRVVLSTTSTPSGGCPPLSQVPLPLGTHRQPWALAMLRTCATSFWLSGKTTAWGTRSHTAQASARKPSTTCPSGSWLARRAAMGFTALPRAARGAPFPDSFPHWGRTRPGPGAWPPARPGCAPATCMSACPGPHHSLR